MKRAHLELYRACELARAIAELAADPERDLAELGVAMVAIGEMARSAHDYIDHALRELDNDPGCGYLHPLLAALDDEISAMKRRASDATS